MTDCGAAASCWLRRRNEPHVDPERACQRPERRGRRVGLASFDAADLGLVDARAIGELLLGEAQCATLRGELMREREVQAQRLKLGDGLGPPRSASTSAMKSLNVVMGASMGYDPYGGQAPRTRRR